MLYSQPSGQSRFRHGHDVRVVKSNLSAVLGPATTARTKATITYISHCNLYLSGQVLPPPLEPDFFLRAEKCWRQWETFAVGTASPRVGVLLDWLLLRTLQTVYERFMNGSIGGSGFNWRIGFPKGSLRLWFIGGPCRDRTCDHLIKSQILLNPLYTVITVLFIHWWSQWILNFNEFGTAF